MFPIFFYLINTPLCSFKVAQEKTIEEENTKFTIDSSPPWVRKVEVDNNLFSILWMRGRTFTILGLVVLLGSPLFEVVTLESLDLALSTMDWRRSVANTNSKGERGSPCLTPLLQ